MAPPFRRHVALSGEASPLILDSLGLGPKWSECLFGNSSQGFLASDMINSFDVDATFPPPRPSLGDTQHDLIVILVGSKEKKNDTRPPGLVNRIEPSNAEPDEMLITIFCMISGVINAMVTVSTDCHWLSIKVV